VPGERCHQADRINAMESPLAREAGYPPALDRDASVTALGTTPDAQPSTDMLLALAHALLTGRHSPELGSFLNEWPHTSKRRSIEPFEVPALRWLPEAKEAAPPFSASFVDALAAAAPSLAWQRSYSPAAVGATFFDNYGWTEVAGLTGPTPSAHLACGVLLLGRNLTYPPHRHEAEEIYVPLSGTAEWMNAAGEWRERTPGSVIHHARYQPHAMRTGQAPMLALYLWLSDNLGQKSRLDPPAPDPTQ
jgi:quercetin dioxygenase-like cupin family protein